MLPAAVSASGEAFIVAGVDKGSFGGSKVGSFSSAGSVAFGRRWPGAGPLGSFLFRFPLPSLGLSIP